jgi:putative peptidoglycan lipid II flippase
MSAANVALNVAVEVPLLWWLGEAGMAVGTLVSFSLQAAVMLWMLDRRVQGLGLRTVLMPALKMLVATGLMGLAVWAAKVSPLYPRTVGRWAWAGQLTILMVLGAAVYLAVCRALGVTTMDQVLPRRLRRTRRPKGGAS